MFIPVKNTLFDKLRFFLTKKISLILRILGISQKQIIICGYPRSGTSLLYNMMSSTLKTKFYFSEFEKYFIFYLHKIGNIASKAPLDIMHIEYLEKLNIHKKNIALIVVIRDIREIITSRHPIYPDKFFIGYDHSYWPSDEKFSNWTYTAPGVIGIRDKIREAEKLAYTTIVKYEDLISDPDIIQKYIGEKYRYIFNLPFSEYHINQDKMSYRYEGKYMAKDNNLVMEGKKVTRKKSRWKKPEYRDRLVEQFTSCPELFDLLIEYGYEEDRTWFEKL